MELASNTVTYRREGGGGGGGAEETRVQKRRETFKHTSRTYTHPTRCLAARQVSIAIKVSKNLQVAVRLQRELLSVVATVCKVQATDGRN